MTRAFHDSHLSFYYCIRLGNRNVKLLSADQGNNFYPVTHLRLSYKIQNVERIINLSTCKSLYRSENSLNAVISFNAVRD